MHAQLAMREEAHIRPDPRVPRQRDNKTRSTTRGGAALGETDESALAAAGVGSRAKGRF